MKINPRVDRTTSIATMLDIRYKHDGEECILIPGQTALILNAKRRRQVGDVLLTLYNVAYSSRVQNGNRAYKWYTTMDSAPMSMEQLQKMARVPAGCDCGMITYKLSSGAPGLYSTRLAADGSALASRMTAPAMALANAHKKARPVEPDLLSLTAGTSDSDGWSSNWRPKICCRSTAKSADLASSMGLHSAYAFDVITQEFVQIDELPIPLLLSPFDEYLAAADRYSESDILIFQQMWIEMVADLLKEVGSYELFIYRDEPGVSLQLDRCYTATEYNNIVVDDTSVVDACSIMSPWQGSLRRWVHSYNAVDDPLFTLDDDTRYAVNAALSRQSFLQEFPLSI